VSRYVIKKNSVASTLQGNYTDEVTAGWRILVPAFAVRGCRVVSGAVSHGR
jgi:hypothetical protein